MKWFWLGLFGFLSLMVLMVGLFRPDLLDAMLAFTGAFLSVALWVFFAGAVLLALVGGGLLGWAWWHGKSVESLRQRDGHYPVQRVKLKDGRIVYIDLNQVVGPALTIDRNTGEITEHEPAAGWQVQSVVRALVERTRQMQAMFQGDASKATQWGSQSKSENLTAAAARLAAGAYDKPAGPTLAPPAVAALQEPEPEPARTWSVRDAFQNNTNTRLVLGQTDSGQLVYWDMMQTPHLRFHGQTQGSGKTNALQTVAAGAARTGAHLIVLDRRSFKDWSEFAGIAELVDSRDPRRFAAAVLALQRVYQERDQLLGQHGAPNIMALPDAPPQVVAVVSEFGALCEVAAGEGVLDDVLAPLKLILREAGATGVHVLFEDQAVDRRWPRGISTNAEPVCGRLPKNYGAAGGYDYAHQLAPYTFHYAGAVFNTWHMRPALRGLLAAAPDLGETLVSGPVVSSQGQFTGAVHASSQGSSPEVDPLQGAAMNSPMNTAPATLDGWYEWTLDNYLGAHPELLQTDAQGRGMGVKALAEAMAGECGKDVDAMKGTASGVAKRLRAEAMLPGGTPLGVDISTGGKG